jgi:hypothetical protein
VVQTTGSTPDVEIVNIAPWSMWSHQTSDGCLETAPSRYFGAHWTKLGRPRSALAEPSRRPLRCHPVRLHRAQEICRPLDVLLDLAMQIVDPEPLVDVANSIIHAAMGCVDCTHRGSTRDRVITSSRGARRQPRRPLLAGRGGRRARRAATVPAVPRGMALRLAAKRFLSTSRFERPSACIRRSISSFSTTALLRSPSCVENSSVTVWSAARVVSSLRRAAPGSRCSSRRYRR